MSSYKYSCPFCGQHIEYTEGYSGRQMPCPVCQQAITFPGVAPGKLTSSLRLVRDIPKPQQKFQFSFAALVLFVREFKHWKVVGMCLIPFVILAGALAAASALRNNGPAPVATSTPAAVDPHAMEKVTDLTRADMAVQDSVQAFNQASAACQTAARNHATPGATAQIQKVKEAAHQAFDKAYAHYQKLGGTIDYQRQLQL